MEKQTVVKNKAEITAIVCFVLTVVIYAVDLQIPLGVAGGVPYMLVVLITVWHPQHWSTITFAVICSLLTLLGYYLSPEGGEHWKVMTNRGLALFAIWSSAVLVMMIRQKDNKLILEKNIAEKANQAKSEFLSSMSHELRTPLNAVMGFAQLLEMDTKLDELQKQSAQEIYKASSHLLSLINDILDLSRIEAGHTELSMEPIDVFDLIAQVKALTIPIAEEHNIEMEFPAHNRKGVFIKADLVRLKQVLLNLLSNAIKYNRIDGKVTLTVEAEPDSDKVRITITDTGPGIAPKLMQKLFQPFNRLGAENTNIPGTGIGLVITKQLVELMRGNIGVDSQLSVGTSFWVELEQVAEDNSAPSKESFEQAISYSTSILTPSERDKAKQIKILIAEDNDSNAMLLHRFLTKIGFQQIDIVTDGQQAQDKLSQSDYHILFTDIQMPVMNGIELIRRIRQHELSTNERLPIVVVTADAVRYDIERCLEVGADDFIAKPADFKKVSAILHTLMLK